VIHRGAIACAHARIRSRKGNLLSAADAAPLFVATDDASVERALTALRMQNPMQDLLDVYRLAIDGYPHAANLFRALLRLHEIENVKLLWRRSIRGVPAVTIHRRWHKLGTLATFENPPDAASLADLAAHLEATPYGAIAASIARSHGSDLAAAELAFDRWATKRLREEARRLPKSETVARQLIELIARERDAQLALRGEAWYGLTTPQTRPSENVLTIRRRRLVLCRRSFAASPFRIAPAMAVILLAEEQVRALTALIERRGDGHLDDALTRATAASQIGG
jgi:hypothetical protein